MILSTLSLPLGPAMIDLAGTRLDSEEAARLRHPLVGGVILFARNFESRDQLTALCASIHALRDPPLLIAVDQEGGRVQRFREGFTRIPAMASLGRLHDADASLALRSAEAVGIVIASELRECGIDLSFTPVLDLDFGASSVIGDRALHDDPDTVSALAGALLKGLSAAGMSGVGKHFPGHGFVSADSHVAVPVDNRELVEIVGRDARPYRALAGVLGGVMPAHVIYDRCDGAPAGFSRFWLQSILREEMGFNGVIFSDDLSMEAAAVAGGIVARAQAACRAGCDMVLVCNDAARAEELLFGWSPRPDARSGRRIASLTPSPGVGLDPGVLGSARERVAAIPALPSRGQGCRG